MEPFTGANDSFKKLFCCLGDKADRTMARIAQWSVAHMYKLTARG